jgi:hypothetical protein
MEGGGCRMKVDRLVSMIMILLDKKRIGAQALAEMFEVSPRTIYRDIDTINMAGIPVRATSGVGGGFEIMQKIQRLIKGFFDCRPFRHPDGAVRLSHMVRGEELVTPFESQVFYPRRTDATGIELSQSNLYRFKPWNGQQNIQAYLEGTNSVTGKQVRSSSMPDVTGINRANSRAYQLY